MPRGRPHFALWLGLLLTCLTLSGPRVQVASPRIDPVALVERASRPETKQYALATASAAPFGSVRVVTAPSEGLVVARTRRLFLEHGALLN